MGLDMYAGKIKRVSVADGSPLPIEAKVDFQREVWEDGEVKPFVKVEELAYWRKHHDLHGLMSRIYEEKGGTGLDFNCDPVMLDLADLDRIEQATINGELPATSGFFFGSGNTDHYRDATIEFVNKAREAIKDGWQVYYNSWW